MYIPPHFEESRVEVLHDLMHTHPLATVVTLASTGLMANHIPLYLSKGTSTLGILQGHVARANPLWSEASPDTEVLVIFQGPQAYISPSWYATKKETGKAVPTWNYIAVHAYGKLRAIDDVVWLRRHLEQLTSRHESGFAEPWKLSDAPDAFITTMIGAIVGIELTLTKLSGKWKISQNQPMANREGVVQGLQARGIGDDALMAELVAKMIGT